MRLAALERIDRRCIAVAGDQLLGVNADRQGEAGCVTRHVVESLLSEADLDVLLYHVGNVASRRAFFDDLPARRKVDAVVVIAFAASPTERDRLERMDVAIIAAGGQNDGYPFVSIDDYRAGRQAVDHLLALGHRKIEMIAGDDPDEPDWALRDGRSRAYFDAHRERSIPIHPTLVQNVD